MLLRLGVSPTQNFTEERERAPTLKHSIIQAFRNAIVRFYNPKNFHQVGILFRLVHVKFHLKTIIKKKNSKKLQKFLEEMFFSVFMKQV